ncbi:hypothetical protein PIGBHMHK_00653 [Mycoplasmopsis arginini]|uniref:hypothetical protein n=1 Tax=Mycoplasmopsis arginini TaxID=2094 RepID=UPI00249E4E22|nr:hypothetical protein [Mycoplasmopsis arginini]MDI3349148.1 hypothetical protein [Mycoplasmopsis arginini]
MNKQDMDYLGDGVYVGHDGYQLFLTTGTHENIELLAIDPDVLKRLNNYFNRIFGELKWKI